MKINFGQGLLWEFFHVSNKDSLGSVALEPVALETVTQETVTHELVLTEIEAMVNEMQCNIAGR